jgi:hypothetical protein
MHNHPRLQFWVCLHGQTPRCYQAHDAHLRDGDLVLVNRWPDRNARAIVAHFPLEMVAYWWKAPPRHHSTDALPVVHTTHDEPPDSLASTSRIP